MRLLTFAMCMLLVIGLSISEIANVYPTSPDSVAMNGQRVEGKRTSESAVDSSFQPMWPTDASKRINSSFAEFRRTHFHAGIDISTNNRTGYPVYAAENGFVATVRVSPSGYGKVLYLQHPNGYVSVYAHLKGFNDILNAVVEEVQQREGKYAVRYKFNPEDIVVQKGDTIGFTGDTGTGSAHLHFEFRDRKLNPLNPLLFKDLRPVDNTPPIIRRLTASPLNAQSTVGGEHSTQIFTAHRRNKRLYELSAPLYATGDIGLGIETRDRRDDSWRNLGVHRTELYVDDERLYASEYDRISVRHSKQVALHFDWPLLARRGRKFQKLYVERGDRLDWYLSSDPSAGTLSTRRFEPGPHPFRVVCSDIDGNTTELHGMLILNERPIVQVAQIHSPLVLEFGQPDRVRKIHVSGRSLTQKSWVTSKFERSTSDASTKRWEMPPLRRAFDLLRIVAVDSWGTRSAPDYYYFRTPTAGDHSIAIEKEFVRDFVVVTLTTNGLFTGVPFVQVHQSGQISQLPLHARTEREYFGAFRPLDELDGPVRLYARAKVDGSWTVEEHSFTLYPIVPRGHTQTLYDDGTFSMAALPQATYQTVFSRIEKREEENETRYAMLPDDQLLNSGVRVTLRAGQQFTNFDKVGMYFRSGRSWEFQRTQKDSVGRTVTAKLQRTLGVIALREDLEPPELHNLRIRTSRGPEISFRVTDDRSGVDADAIELYIDDKLVIAEYEEESHSVRYRPKKNFGKGPHTLFISALDRVKNKTTLTRTFRSAR